MGVKLLDHFKNVIVDKDKRGMLLYGKSITCNVIPANATLHNSKQSINKRMVHRKYDILILCTSRARYSLLFDSQLNVSCNLIIPPDALNIFKAIPSSVLRRKN